MSPFRVSNLFDVAISEGSHVAVVISFKATFSTRPRTPYPGTPALRFPPTQSCHDFTGGFAQISREKKNFRYFIWFEGCVSLRKSKIGFFNPKESENGFCVSLVNRSIQDLSDHGGSKEPKNPVPEWILRFL